MTKGDQTFRARASIACAAFLLLFASASVAWAGSALIVGVEDTTPAASGNTPAVRIATANLKALLEGAGHVVDFSPAVPADLSTYDQVWDLRIDIGSGFAPAVQIQYQAYLVNGGTLVLIGENASEFFMPRNNAIVDLIDEAGGGSLTFAPSTSSSQTVQPPFNSPISVTTVQMGSGGGVSTSGRGRFITKGADERGAGVAFGRSQLTNALRGTLLAVFDINFMMNPAEDPSAQLLLRNIVSFLSPAEPAVQTIGNVIANAGRPFGAAVHNGYAYVADPESHTVWKFNVSNPADKTPVAGIGWNPDIDPADRAGYNGDGIDALQAQLDNPSGVAVDASGNVYIADTGNHAVRKIAAGSTFITTVAGIPTSYAVGENTDPACQNAGANLDACMPAISARLWGPRAVAVDPAGDVYIVDRMNQQVKKLYISGTLSGFIFPIAGLAGYTGSTNGPATGPIFCTEDNCTPGARLNSPVGVAVSVIDGETIVYIADEGNNRIRTVSAEGEVQTLQVAGLRRPTGVAVAGGTIYIADYGNHLVRRATNCSSDGCSVVTIVGTGTAGSAGNVGDPGTSVQLNSPIALTLDGNVLYIADMLNGRILSGDFSPPVLLLR